MEIIRPRLFPVVCLTSLLTLALGVVPREASTQERITRNSGNVLRAREAAPELYADQLRMTVTLVNLPGANDPQSTFTGSCRLFFVPEADWIKITRQKPSGNIKLDASDFQSKVKLTEINFKKTNLAKLKDRIEVRNNISFGSRIPVEQKTKLARLITDCSVKVYDAQLKSSVFSSGVFTTRPFAAQSEDPTKLHPRTNIYVSFLVTPEREIFRSQAPRNADSLEWP